MNTWLYPSWVMLALTLAAACWTDWHERRIPNILSLAALGFALAWQAAAPAGDGLFNLRHPGATGVLPALGAAALAFGAFLLLHRIGVMGAGDVKLMAPVGAFFGSPVHVLPLLAAIVLAGGLLALSRMGSRSRRAQMRHNLGLIWMGLMYRRQLAGVTLFDPRRDTADRLPYAFAIALGSSVYAALLLGGVLHP